MLMGTYNMGNMGYILVNFKKEVKKLQKVIATGDSRKIEVFLFEKLREIVELREQNNMLRSVYAKHEEEKSVVLHKVMVANTLNGQLQARIKELEAELGGGSNIPGILRVQ